MADNNQLPRRSSILKTASDENTASGPSKAGAMLKRRVSFHNTRTVKEYIKGDHLAHMTPQEEPMQLTMSSDGRADLSYSATVMAGAGQQNMELTNTVTFGMAGPQVSSTPLTSRRRSSSCPRFVNEDTGSVVQPRPALFPADTAQTRRSEPNQPLADEPTDACFPMLSAANNANKTVASEPRDRRSVANATLPAERTSGVFTALEGSQNVLKSRMETEVETCVDELTDNCFQIVNAANNVDKTAASEPRDRRSVANSTMPADRTFDAFAALEHSENVRKLRVENEMLNAANTANKTAALEPKDRRSVANSTLPEERTFDAFAALEHSENVRKLRVENEMLNAANNANKTPASEPRDRRSVANSTQPAERTFDPFAALEHSENVRKLRMETEVEKHVDQPSGTCFPMLDAANNAKKTAASEPRDRKSVANATLPAEKTFDALEHSEKGRELRTENEVETCVDEPTDNCFQIVNAADNANKTAASEPRDRKSVANATLPAEKTFGVFAALEDSENIRKSRMETEVETCVDELADNCFQIVNAANNADKTAASEPRDRRSVANATLPEQRTLDALTALEHSQNVRKLRMASEQDGTFVVCAGARQQRVVLDETTSPEYTATAQKNIYADSNIEQSAFVEDEPPVANATLPEKGTFGVLATLEVSKNVSESFMEIEQDGTFVVCAGARQQQVLLDDTTSAECTTTTQRNIYADSNIEQSAVMEEEPAQTPPRAHGECRYIPTQTPPRAHGEHRYIPMLSTLQEEAASCLTRTTTSFNNTISSPILAKKMADLQEKMMRSTDRRRRHSMDYVHSHPSVLEARSLLGELTGGLDAVVPPEEALLELSITRTRTSVGGTLATARELSRRSAADHSIPPMHGDELMEHMTPVSLHHTSMYDRSMANRTGRNFTEPTYEASRLLQSPSTTSPMAKRSRLAEGATPLRLSFDNNSRNESQLSEQPLSVSTIGEQPSSELPLSELQLSQTFETSLNLSAKAERAGIQANLISLPEALQPKETAPNAVKDVCVQVHEQLNDAVRMEVERLRPIIRARMDQMQTIDPSLWRALRKVDTNTMTPRQRGKFDDARTQAAIALHELLTPVMRRAGDALEQRITDEERKGNAESAARRVHLEEMKARLAQYETFLATPLEDIEKWEHAARRFLDLKRQFIDIEKERMLLEIRRRDQRSRTIDQLINLLQTGLGDLDNIEEEISGARAEVDAVVRSVHERQERLAEELAQLGDD